MLQIKFVEAGPTEINSAITIFSVKLQVFFYGVDLIERDKVVQ